MADEKDKLQELEDKLREITDKEDDNPEGPLYHYTSSEGVAGILNTKELWLTHHKHLNDPSEILHGKRIILSYLNEYLINREKLRNEIVEMINSIVEDGYNTFVASFCKEKDYLPAWRYYGNDGAGFCIGFKQQYFVRKNLVTEDEKEKSTLFLRLTM